MKTIVDLVDLVVRETCVAALVAAGCDAVALVELAPIVDYGTASAAVDALGGVLKALRQSGRRDEWLVRHAIDVCDSAQCAAHNISGRRTYDRQPIPDSPKNAADRIAWLFEPAPEAA